VVATATAEETVMDAAIRMRDNNVGCLVIVDGERKPVGIVTDRDIVTRSVADELNPSDTVVSAVMTDQPRSVDESTPIEQALSTMGGAGARRLVVTGEEGNLVGLLTLDDVLELMVEEATSIGAILRREAPKIMAAG
jgi:CBS domain-containing protein